MGGTGSGGKRKNAGRKKGVPHRVRKYRIPLEYLEECGNEMKEVLRKYREKCRTQK